MDTFDPLKLSKYMLYVDSNKLYGWSQSQPLSYGGFEWINLVTTDPLLIPDKSPKGYFLEGDLNTFTIDMNMCLSVPTEHQVPPGFKLQKLMKTPHNKEKYVLHFRNLKQTVENGQSA